MGIPACDQDWIVVTLLDGQWHGSCPWLLAAGVDAAPEVLIVMVPQLVITIGGTLAYQPSRTRSRRYSGAAFATDCDSVIHNE
jgi:hypothetical protein